MLNPEALAALITSKRAQYVEALDLSDPGQAAQVRQADARAIAESIVEHIQAAAQVMPGIPVATAGSPSAQTGATTAPGVIQ